MNIFDLLGVSVPGALAAILLLACVLAALIWLVQRSPTIGSATVKLILALFSLVICFVGWPLQFLWVGLTKFPKNRSVGILKFWGALWRCGVVILCGLFVTVMIAVIMTPHGGDDLLMPVIRPYMRIFWGSYGSLSIALALAQIIYWPIRSGAINKRRAREIKPIDPWAPFVWHQITIWVNMEDLFFGEHWKPAKNEKVRKKT